MQRVCGFTLALAMILTGGTATADLSGATRALCAAVQATECNEAGDCDTDLPWNLNIPEFIEIDLEAKQYMVKFSETGVDS